MPTPIILITGGTGFAGSHLVEALLEQAVPAESIHVTNFAKKPSFVDKLLPAANIHQLDLTDAAATFALFEKLKPTQIYHLASFSSPSLSLENTTKAIETNVEIQLNVLEAMRQHTPQARLLSIGSASEYAGTNEPLSETSQLGPHDPYGVSKVAQDMLAHSYTVRYQLPIVRVRPFNHIGERQEPGFVVSDFARRIVEIEKGLERELKVGNLQVSRDFTDVKDIVKAYILLMNQGKIGEVYNLGSGQDVTIEELLAKMKTLAKVGISVTVDQVKQRPGDINRSVADNSKIKALGWQPTIPLDETLARILNWWRLQPERTTK
jgi:GDP-4-dehydro-6-deoxy-D-mannose reductase